MAKQKDLTAEQKAAKLREKADKEYEAYIAKQPLDWYKLPED